MGVLDHFEGALNDFSAVIKLELDKGKGREGGEEEGEEEGEGNGDSVIDAKDKDSHKNENENCRGEWGFKALEQMIYITFKLGRYVKMMELYRSLLHDYSSVVTPNTSTKAINSILD